MAEATTIAGAEAPDAVATVIEVLGEIRVYDRDASGDIVREARVDNRRAALLLALLVAEHGRHPFADLIRATEIAPNDELAKSNRDLLHQTILQVRRWLGPAADLVVTNNGLKTYELVRDETRLIIDIDDADQAASDEDWATVLAKHRGRFAQDIDADKWALESHRTSQRAQIVLAIGHLRSDLSEGTIQNLADQVLAGRMIADILPAQRKPQGSLDVERLVLARDMQRSYELRGTDVVGTPARIAGLIARRKRAGAHVFLDVIDETGAIQVAVHEGTAPWDLASELDVRASVRVHGELQLFAPKHGPQVLTLLADEVERIAVDEAERPEAMERQRAASSIFLARLANHFRSALSEEGYAEVETKLISSDWPSGGVEVLKVLYDGMGPGAFALAPSPVSQLIQHLIRLPVDRVFTVGRCITPTYRDPHVSTEAMVVAGVALDVSIVEALKFVHETAVNLHRSGSTAPSAHVAPNLTQRDLKWPPSQSAGVDAPELQVFEPMPVPEPESADPHAMRQVARLCWPYFHEEPWLRDYVLAEGYSRITQDESGTLVAGLTVLSINIEQLLTLLLDEYEGRPIPALFD